MGEHEMSRHDNVLIGLVFSLQSAAMQQMGKIQDPVTGEVVVDLAQARATIDILEMLKAKCRTGTPEALLRVLDGAVMDLQLNYVDELKKSRRDKAAPAPEQADPEAPPAGPPADEGAPDATAG